MSEIRRGYPNPNYTEADVDNEITAKSKVGIVTVTAQHYADLIRKATALEIIAADIKNQIDDGKFYAAVNDSLVIAATGMKAARDNEASKSQN